MSTKVSQLPEASSVAGDDYIAVLDCSENILKKAHVSHASEDPAFGLGTADKYGHVKTVDNVNHSMLVSGEALSARQGYVLANNMGQLEPTNIAAYNHAVGEYFIVGGQFVKCISNIQIGNTITLNGNAQATNIGSVLNQLNNQIATRANTRSVPVTEPDNQIATEVSVKSSAVTEPDNQIVNSTEFIHYHEVTVPFDFSLEAVEKFVRVFLPAYEYLITGLVTFTTGHSDSSLSIFSYHGFKHTDSEGDYVSIFMQGGMFSKDSEGISGCYHAKIDHDRVFTLNKLASTPVQSTANER